MYLLLAGFALSRIRTKPLAVLLAWCNVLIAVALAVWLSVQCGAILKMLLIVAFLFLSIKALSLVNTFDADNGLCFVNWLLYSVLWVGMDPAPFKRIAFRSLSTGKGYLLSGMLNLFAGAIILKFDGFLMEAAFGGYYLFWALALVGLSLSFHFGLLKIMTGIWRYAGVDVRVPFDAPQLSTSLTEFWGKRWNIAFVEMTTTNIFLPLKKRTGPIFALMAVFTVSGLFHELAISVPVASGYGKPLSYFVLQGALVLFERKYLIRISTIKKWERYWTFAMLTLPLPLLFPKEFSTQILFELLDVLA